MKRSFKILGLTLALACVFSATAAASAFASEFWYVSPSEAVTGEQTIEGELTGGSATLIGSVGGISTTITCTSATTTGTIENVGGLGEANYVALTFEGCTVAPTRLNCTISSKEGTIGKIVVSRLAGTTEAGTGKNVTFHSELGSTFVTLETHDAEGAKCKLGNKTLLPVEGTSTGAATPGFITFTGNNGLTFGGNPAQFNAKFTQHVGAKEVEVK